MKYQIFERNTEILEEQKDLNKIAFSTCVFKYIHFHNTEASLPWFDRNLFNIVKAHPEVFQEGCLGHSPSNTLET